MSHQLIDTFTDKVLGSYETLEAAEKALTHCIADPGRYEIKSPPKPRAKKANVKKEGN